jgi:hypothetical protein
LIGITRIIGLRMRVDRWPEGGSSGTMLTTARLPDLETNCLASVRLAAVLPSKDDVRTAILRELIEIAPFEESAHIELLRTLLRRAFYAEAAHQIDASVTRFQSEGIEPTSLKSAVAGA